MILGPDGPVEHRKASIEDAGLFHWLSLNAPEEGCGRPADEELARVTAGSDAIVGTAREAYPDEHVCREKELRRRIDGDDEKGSVANGAAAGAV